MTPSKASILVALACAACLPVLAGDSELMRAMRDEMDRAVNELRLGEMERPFFISYLVREVTDANATAELGSVVSRSEASSRRLTVQVRVGDRNLDSTNFYGQSRGSSALARADFPVPLPLGDDYGAIRRQIWLATDRSYKSALDRIARKRAALQNETRIDEIPDFSDEEPHTYTDEAAAEGVDLDRLAALVRELSEAFSGMAHVSASEVRGSATVNRFSYVNSEGSSYVRSAPIASINVRAGTQAEDGTVLEDSFTEHALILDELPKGESVSVRARELAGRLKALRDAPHIDRYTGPVLFQGQAAAELVRRVLAPRLLALRMPVAEDARMGRFLEQQTNPFVDRIGARVLPRFLNIVDDPTIDSIDGSALLGSYEVDFEGVPASPTDLVQRGFLKTLLSNRTPVLGVASSSGNDRGSGPAPSNLIVESRDGLTKSEMLEELLAMAEERELEYAVRVERIGGSLGIVGSRSRRGGPTSRSGDGVQLGAVVAYRVYPDGREERIRQAVAVGVTESSFRDIVAASEERTVHTAPFQFRNRLASRVILAQGPALVSYLVPSLLFEDVTIRRPQGNIPRPPIVSQPPLSK